MPPELCLTNRVVTGTQCGFLAMLSSLWPPACSAALDCLAWGLSCMGHPACHTQRSAYYILLLSPLRPPPPPSCCRVEEAQQLPAKIGSEAEMLVARVTDAWDKLLSLPPGGPEAWLAVPAANSTLLLGT